MIARLVGMVAERAADHVVIDVAGVGFRVFVSAITLAELPAIGETATVMVHTQVREDAISLYGFASGIERELFRTLLKLSGIGPRNAIQILSGMPLGELVEAIAAGDVDRLVRLPGVGRKTAERIAVELRDRIGALSAQAGAPASGGAPSGRLASETLEALVKLGLPRPRAERAVREVAARVSSSAPLEEWIREALREVASP